MGLAASDIAVKRGESFCCISRWWSSDYFWLFPHSLY